LGGAGAGAAEVEALLREFPALGRTEDGRVKCSLTGHVMHAKPEVVRPYVRGKRFTQASAKARAMDALKQFEPHIVRSAFLPDKLFCRITGRYLAANERAVAQHSAGRRFERGVEALSRLKTETGAKNVLLTERDPRVAETQSREAAAKREADADASRVVSAAKARAAAAATAEAEAEAEADPRAAAKREADADASRVVSAAKARAAAAATAEAEAEAEADPRAAAERERLRVNGGFSKELGCWVPPAHLLETDSDEEEEARERSDGASDDEESDEEGSESESETSDDDAPDVRMPNFAKIAARIGSSARARAAGPPPARAEKKPPARSAPSAGAAKRPPEAKVKKGKKTGAKPAKRVKP
jgi:hypothetical protein